MYVLLRLLRLQSMLGRIYKECRPILGIANRVSQMTPKAAKRFIGLQIVLTTVYGDKAPYVVRNVADRKLYMECGAVIPLYAVAAIEKV
jgi:hypothetical protein